MWGKVDKYVTMMGSVDCFLGLCNM
jgi:hypothetical protein